MEGYSWFFILFHHPALDFFFSLNFYDISFAPSRYFFHDQSNVWQGKQRTLSGGRKSAFTVTFFFAFDTGTKSIQTKVYTPSPQTHKK